MPSKKKTATSKKTPAISGADGKKTSQRRPELENSELLRTKGKQAFKKIASLVLGRKKKGEEIKPELKVKCLIFLAEYWAKNARKKLETASDFEATLADIARRAAEKYDRKCKKQGSGKGG